jgi:DNA-binding NarL/FixJ family response regulator
MSTTVLTADDDQGFRNMLRSLLSQDPAITLVGEAENGDEAVRATRKLHPDVVLLDITMPRANGFDATRLIKTYRPQTKVIVLTVHAERNYEQAAIAYGADAFIAKKRLSSDLLPAIRLLADSPETQAAKLTEKARSILVIDNDPEFRRTLAGYLRARMNASIEECQSSETDVLAKATTLRPDVVTVDWEGSGAWIVECLRGLFPELGIIALTSFESDIQREAVFAAGADASVVKSQYETALLPITAALAQNDRESGAPAKSAGEINRSAVSSAIKRKTVAQ